MTQAVSNANPRFGTWYKVTSVVKKGATESTSRPFMDSTWLSAQRFVDQLNSPAGNKKLQARLKEADSDFQADPFASVYSTEDATTVLIATGHDARETGEPIFENVDAAIRTKAASRTTKQLQLEESKTLLSDLRQLPEWHSSGFTIIA